MAEIADVERRVSRQLANIEAEDTAQALLRRIGDRIGELE